MSFQRSQGFTLIELMVVVVVLAIAATVAVPSFQQVIENNRLATEANRVLSAITYTRSEAVRLGDEVSMTAASGGFANGWCVHSGANCSGTDALRQFNGADLAFSSSGTSLTFNARGEMTNSNFQITIQPVSCDSNEVGKRRTISVSLSGRASIAKGDCPP